MMAPRREVHAIAAPEGRTWEDDRVLPADPLVLDPYSPTRLTHGPEQSGSDPLALDPYSPPFPSALL
jgi:hypothetical protein